MARKFNFRGRSLESLRAMPISEFASLLTSRARRAIKRTNERYKKLVEKISKAKNAKLEGTDKVIKTHIREAVIMPDWVGLKFGIHNGKDFKTVEIKDEMIGRRLGEFSHTTARVLHSGPGVGATRGSKFIPLK